MAQRKAEGTAVGTLPPGAAWSCRFGRSAQEMLPREIPDHLLPVVEALLSAQTDEAARRTLGLSPRTFSRRVAELLGHLNAATRFQGGAELARRSHRDHCGCAAAAASQALASSSHGPFAGLRPPI
ncbi:hypothetical protein [Actinomadura sp. 3N407]|uniref:hypothetical protein n=1 Tax=Actinomadura sp. 3N407 TaxID=3457423 RepID=UPI003FCE2A33